MITMVAGEDDDGSVFLTRFPKRLHDFTNLSVHVSHGGEIARDRFMLLLEVHFHVFAGLVVDPRFRNVVPITR